MVYQKNNLEQFHFQQYKCQKQLLTYYCLEESIKYFGYSMKVFWYKDTAAKTLKTYKKDKNEYITP